jgi:tRNA(Ile)-lysidine synthase
MKNIDILPQLANKELDLTKHVLSKISGFKDITKFHVGFSGGSDSHVLLAIAAELKHAGYIKELQAIHINHSISDNSNRWEEHCKNIAYNLNIPCKTITIKLKDFANLEHNARVARYTEFSKLINTGEALLLAHHLDDQLETILMRLFKGAGSTGICGIKDVTTINNMQVIRPLLEVPKENISSFISKHNLIHINDPSNTDCNLERNYIRHEIIPTIKNKWPKAAQNITRSVSHITSQEEYISNYCEIHLQKISHGNKLAIIALSEYTFAEQKMLLRAWIMKHNTYAPSSQILNKIFKELIKAKIDRNPIININKIQLRRFKNHIYLLPRSYKKNIETQDIIWASNKKTIYIQSINKTLQRNGILMPYHDDFTIKFRIGGEIIARYQDKPSKTLKKLMYECEIPPWDRNNIPLIYYKDELICVVGLFLAEKYKSLTKQEFNICYL